MESNGEGIRIYGSSSIFVSGNSFTGDTGNGIYSQSSNDVIITENSVSASYFGIYVNGGFATITRNTMLDAGITVATGGSAYVSGNNVTRISLLEAVSTDVVDNRILGYGIEIASVANITISSNMMERAGIELITIPPSGTLSISTSNLVNGRPVYYYNNCRDIDLDGIEIGQLILVNCQNVRVANLEISMEGVGVYVASVDRLVLEHSQLVTNFRVQYSSNILTTGTNFTSTGYLSYIDKQATLMVERSTNVTIDRNMISSQQRTGVMVSDSVSVEITYNVIHDSVSGISASASQDIAIQANTIVYNRASGIGLGGIIAATVAGNDIINNGAGIGIDGGTDLNVTRNSIAHNEVGISVTGSVTGSHIHRNDMLFNTRQAEYSVVYSYAEDLWDSGYPVGGNYWSDYKGADWCSGPSQDQCDGPDGIGDTPYMGLHQIHIFRKAPPLRPARYPLMSPVGDFSQDKTSPSWSDQSRLAYAYVNSTSVTLSWTPAADNQWVVAYRVYQENSLLAVVAGATQSHTVRGLTTGEIYRFTVEAGDPAGNWTSNGPSIEFLFTEPPSSTGTAEGVADWAARNAPMLIALSTVPAMVGIALGVRRIRNHNRVDTSLA